MWRLDRVSTLTNVYESVYKNQPFGGQTWKTKIYHIWSIFSISIAFNWSAIGFSKKSFVFWENSLKWKKGFPEGMTSLIAQWKAENTIVVWLVFPLYISANRKEWIGHEANFEWTFEFWNFFVLDDITTLNNFRIFETQSRGFQIWRKIHLKKGVMWIVPSDS